MGSFYNYNELKLNFWLVFPSTLSVKLNHGTVTCSVAKTKGKGCFVRQQIGSSWNRSNSIGCSQHFSCPQVSCIRGQAVFWSSLSPSIWTLCSNSRSSLFTRFVRCVCIVSLTVFRVRTLMLVIFIHLY